MSEARNNVVKLNNIVNVQEFGAVGDGVADDTAAIQAAIDYVETLNGGIVQLDWGTFKITSTLNINSSLGVQLIGQGGDGVHDGGTGAFPATQISWFGTANGTMINIASPSGVANSRQYGSTISDIRLNCRSIAGIGLLVDSVRFAEFKRIFILRPTIAGVKTTTLGNANLGEATDTQRCVFDRIQVRTIDNASTQPAHGFWLTSHAPALSDSNTSLNLFSQCDLQMWGGSGGGYGLFIEDGDNNTFVNLRIFRVNTTVEAVRIVGNTYCDANHFWNLSAGGANSIVIRGTASGFPINPTKNSFWVVDVNNGTQYPTIDNGVEFIWQADDGPFVKLPAFQMAVGDSIASANAARAALSTASLRVANTSQSHIVLTDGTNVWVFRLTSTTCSIERVAGTAKFNLPDVTLLQINGQDVSLGAADSGGTGYKLLRIPN